MKLLLANKQLNIAILILFFLTISCKEDKLKFSLKKQNAFMPYFHTDIEMNEEDSIWLVKYQKTSNKSIILDSSKICISNLYDDVGYSTKWRFMLCDSFEVGYDYKIEFKVKNKKYSYFFSDINYDTIRFDRGYRYDTKAYTLNGLRYFDEDCDYKLK